MTNVSLEIIIPERSEIKDGRRVYRSTHIVSVYNGEGADVFYNVEATMFDSFGNSNSSGVTNVVATIQPQASSEVYFADLDANLYSAGTVVAFTCETHVTGALSASDRRTGEFTAD